ncbi:phosphoribosylformylglycinamidine synthase [bacterium]|nr:phosphoribosylformylglycinamidine synthase [bacterium]
MFVRVEVGMRPEFPDPAANGLLRRIELAHPDARKAIRWARMLDVFWIDAPFHREETISLVTTVFWDKVVQWLFTGNLIPAAAGKSGSIQDLMEAAPNRPGNFWAIEKRFRPGVTDNVGRTAQEALAIVSRQDGKDQIAKFNDSCRVSSGSFLLLEGPKISEGLIESIARDVFCNELIETWVHYNEVELKKNDRFQQDRVKRDLPRISMQGNDEAEVIRLGGLSDENLVGMSNKRLWALSLPEMQAIRNYFSDDKTRERRREVGLADPTDVEMEVLAQTWSEHCKHKLFGAEIDYTGVDQEKEKIPSKIDGLFKTTIVNTTRDLPRAWLLSVFDDNAGIIALNDDTAFCIKVETHNSPSALDPYGGALTGIVGVNRDILGCGLGALPVFNTDVFCVAEPDYSKMLPDRILHPRRILDGVRRGVEHGGNKSGIPTVNGALVFDDRFLGKPLIYCGTGGILPRKITLPEGERSTHLKEIHAGDHVCMVGGRIGKDGIHGATFSSLAMDESSPVTAVQLGDPITQKRAADFLLEARDLGLYRAITDNGAGGLSSSVGEMARISGGARIDVSKAKTKYPGLKPYELTVSESQERMTVAVQPECLAKFKDLAARRGVEVSDLGIFSDTGLFEVYYGDRIVASLDLEFLHKGAPRIKLQAKWNGPTLAPAAPAASLKQENAEPLLLGLLGRPNIASKEWLIRQYDHEVQGMSVIKPLQLCGLATPEAFSSPNDAGVIKPIAGAPIGVAVGCGINPKLSDIDAYLMAQAAVDESIRNVLCVGAEYGTDDSVLALVDNFCWPDPVGDLGKSAALVRACYGLRDAAMALGAPLVSGKDSMKNDFKGRRGNEEIKISVPPTLLMTAVAKVQDIHRARSSDFKNVGDRIYAIGGIAQASSGCIGLLGSEYALTGASVGSNPRVGRPDWELAKKLYKWLGGAEGKELGRLRSLHDISEGGLLVAVAESMIGRGLGANITIPSAIENAWEFCFGEGFHSFMGSASESDAASLEAEMKLLGIPFISLGSVSSGDRLEVRGQIGAENLNWDFGVQKLRSAWKKEGYWE